MLAYSTISQLGFMVAAVGCGGVVAGMFHMVTHAFFKSCLFLSAGSVIHGCHHEQDMRKMGGLRKMMPLTFAAMLISTLAIAGVPLFSGFYSKDMIIQYSFLTVMGKGFDGAGLFTAIALPLAAALTAFYMFRLIFMTFTGTYRGGHEEVHHLGAESAGHDADHGHDDGHGDHGHAHVPHESPRPMTVALLCLAGLGFLGGSFWLVGPFGGDGKWFPKSASVARMYPAEVNEAIPRLHLEVLAHEADRLEAQGQSVAHLPAAAVDRAHLIHSAHSRALMVSLLVAGLGILLAYLIYVRRTWDPAAITARLGLVYTTVRDKYYIDEVVNATVIKLTMASSKGLKLFDEYVVDGTVLLVGRINRGVGFMSAAFDRLVVDGLVNYLALACQALGAVVRLFQTGRIQQYATFAMAGGLLLAAWMILA